MRVLIILLLNFTFSFTYGQQSQTIHHGEIEIAYRACGEGSPTLLFVHGWNINEAYWEAQLEHFCPSYQVVAIGLPGFWQPDAKREAWTVEAFGQDVVQVMESLELDKVILIGHSMGGNIILEAALAAPDRVIGLIGIDNFKDPRATEYSEEEEEGFRQFLAALRADYSNAITGFAEGMLFHPETPEVYKQRVLKDFKAARPEVAIGSIEQLIHYTQKEARQLQRLDKKLYLLHSDYSPSDEAALERYCGAGYEIVRMEGVGHYPMIEKPEVFNKQLELLVEKVVAEASPKRAPGNAKH